MRHAPGRLEERTAKAVSGEPAVRPDAAGLPWGWQPRQPAAGPAAAVGWGAVALRLHHYLAQLGPPAQAALTATAASGVLVVTGSAAALPWVDGVAYAAPSTVAPALWLPTVWEPDVAADLLAAALRGRHERQPLLVWPHPSVVLPLDRLLPVSPALLARIAQCWPQHPPAQGQP